MCGHWTLGNCAKIGHNKTAFLHWQEWKLEWHIQQVVTPHFGSHRSHFGWHNPFQEIIPQNRTRRSDVNFFVSFVFIRNCDLLWEWAPALRLAHSHVPWNCFNFHRCIYDRMRTKNGPITIEPIFQSILCGSRPNKSISDSMEEIQASRASILFAWNCTNLCLCIIE